MNLISKAREVFGVEVKEYPKVTRFVGECTRAYAGMPDWVDDDEHIRTINFAKSICSEVARLTTLGTKVTFEGSRAEYLQNIIDKCYYNFRKWCEYADAYGTVIIKPNGEDFDVYLPGEFYVTQTLQDEIWGAIFVAHRPSEDEKQWYTRFEYHRFEGDQYIITNKCYVGASRNSADEEIAIEDSPWWRLSEEVAAENIERPLFAPLSTPQANNLDPECPLSLPVFAEAMNELRDLDIAYSRNSWEIEESKRTVLLDSDRLMMDGGNLNNKNTKIGGCDHARKSMGLPDYVKAVEGTGEGNMYNEINPSLNTAVRVLGINQLLSQIGYKVGFANGYFVFDESKGIQTATGVEADQQRTVQFIKDCRDRLERCISDLIEAISKFADMYAIAPAGDYEVNYEFGDILYNYEEEKARWLMYVQMGKVAFWRFLVKFEGMTEEEAKEIEAETQMQAQQQQAQGLFA